MSAVVEALCGETISAPQVSSITASLAASLDASLAAWRARPLTAKAYPYLVVDVHVARVRARARCAARRCSG